MGEKCILCEEGIEENYGKLIGTMIKAKNEFGVNYFIHVCSGCQKIDNWYETALIKGV